MANPTPHGAGVRGFNLAPSSRFFNGRFGRMFRALPPADFGDNDDDSQKALRKLGAVQEGLRRRSARRGQEYIDQVLWSLLKDDWSDHWVSIAPRVH